jgi:hypothetical protein
MSLSKFLSSCTGKNIGDVYRAAAMSALGNEIFVEKGTYTKKSSIYKYADAIFNEVRKRAIELRGKTFVSEIDKDLNYMSRENIGNALEDLGDKLNE